MDKPPKFCIECKKNVVNHYKSHFCEDCSRDFFEVKKDENKLEKDKRLQ